MHVTIIAKSPVPGFVKTRLCPPCSSEQAAEVAAAALNDTIAAINAIVTPGELRRILLWDGEPLPAVPEGYEVASQQGNGLGERLANGFRQLGPGVIIGMETPHAAYALADAIRAVTCGLDAIGLATDGGYWSIGLCSSTVEIVDEVFAGVEMSRSQTGLAQLRRLHQLGGKVRMLPMARDLDTFEDLRSVADSGRAGELPILARKLVNTIGA